MKRILFFLSLIVTVGCTRAQNNANIKNIPDYRILGADSVYRTPANLKKNQPVMIVYFSPDCSHCQHLINEIKGQVKDFSKIQIVMVSAVDYRMIKGFYKEFGISAYPNITVGTEGNSYKVLQYYNVKTTPYIAIYNHQHKLLKAYEKAPEIEELAVMVKKA